MTPGGSIRCTRHSELQPGTGASARSHLPRCAQQRGLRLQRSPVHLPPVQDGAEMQCTGWLAIAGHRHPTVRLSVMRDQLDPGHPQPGPDWPALRENHGQGLQKLRASAPAETPRPTMGIRIKPRAGPGAAERTGVCRRPRRMGVRVAAAAAGRIRPPHAGESVQGSVGRGSPVRSRGPGRPMSGAFSRRWPR